MAQAALRSQQDHGVVIEGWPFDASHVPELKIGEVRGILAREFPLLSVSKIRHFETIGLIHPRRTASNQRLFSQADVRRLTYILRLQRDRYLPLTQIGELLRRLDAGDEIDPEEGRRIHVIEEDDVQRPEPGTRLKVAEVAELTGVAVSQIEAMINAGIISADNRGKLTSHSPDAVRYAAMLQQLGLDMRQIKQIRTSAHAHAAMIMAHLAPERTGRTSVDRERVLDHAGEMSTLFTRLYQALLAESTEVALR
ncbi:MAG: MerR family transcriptional regulator [Actinomycetaceae bacterium]|nr:MerR family transcriptional regulator [Actinomycetaceae bacterium]MDY6083181.1 MerR family transcriptional regulator [Actinomycetaceae bacterium]